MQKIGSLGALLSVVPALVAMQGCKKMFSSTETEPSPSASAVPVAPVKATANVSLIPQGTLLAGSSCEAVPRISTEELPGTAIAMAEYSIDTYPYPNDLTKPPMTNVSRDEAAQLCAQAGKRLCTELEWERACKGGANQEYEYGNTYNASTCAPAPGGSLVGQRVACTSSFGVRDLHGLVNEWTDSAWGRGTSGGLVSVRGGVGPNGELTSRCANGQGHAPLEKSPTIGFRCCSGAKGQAEVNITVTKEPPLVQEPSVDAALRSRLLNALGKDLRTPATATPSIDQIWRWHPRANEEILVARYTAQPKTGGPSAFRELAFKVCGNATHLLAQTRGPVDRADNPATGTDPQRASVHVASAKGEGDIHFNYVYGRVNLEQPAFIVGSAGAADAGALVADASTALGAAPAAALPAQDAGVSSGATANAAPPVTPVISAPTAAAPQPSSRAGRRVAH